MTSPSEKEDHISYTTIENSISPNNQVTTGCNHKFPKLIYTFAAGGFLISLSTIFLSIGGFTSLFGYFLFPFALYIFVCLTGFVAFGVEVHIGSEKFFTLVKRSLSVVLIFSSLLTFCVWVFNKSIQRGYYIASK